MLSEPIAITLLVIDVLEELNVPYVIGGSLASTQHGLSRNTYDSDLIVQLDAHHVNKMVEMLKDTFYIDADMAYRAIEHKNSFNIIHFETTFKVDLFIATDRPFDHAQIARRQSHSIGKDSDRKFFVLSPEDTILAKLAWFRLGADTSERQWNDILGVLGVQKNNLDWSYINEMAISLQVSDLAQTLQEMTTDE